MNRFVRQSGVSVLECIVALSVLAAMLSILLSIQVIQSTRIGLVRQRLVAEQTLNNLAQRIVAADGPEALPQEKIDQWIAAMEEEQGLPPKTLQVETQAITEPAPGQRFQLSWQPASKKLPAYQLVTWRFVFPTTSSIEEPQP